MGQTFVPGRRLVVVDVDVVVGVVAAVEAVAVVDAHSRPWKLNQQLMAGNCLIAKKVRICFELPERHRS